MHTTQKPQSQKSRSYFDKRRLLEIDTEILKEIESKNFTSELEPFLADLLDDIIVYDKLDNNENCFKALDILEKKFQDKQHLFNVASEFANYHNTGYPYIIAKIFSSLKNTITDNYDGNVKALQKIYEFIKTPYIIEISTIEKVLKHDCHDFEAKRAQNKKFCKHLAKLFLVLKDKDEIVATTFLENITKDINKWEFVV